MRLYYLVFVLCVRFVLPLLCRKSCVKIITPLVLYFLSERCPTTDDRSTDKAMQIDWTDDVEEDDDVEEETTSTMRR